MFTPVVLGLSLWFEFISGGFIIPIDGFLPLTVSNTVGSCSSLEEAPTISSECPGKAEIDGQKLRVVFGVLGFN